jgi:hypothetical protein
MELGNVEMKEGMKEGKTQKFRINKCSYCAQNE